MSSLQDELVGEDATTFNADAITASEAAEILEMRQAVDTSSQPPEIAHDYFFVRFLRGYQHDRTAAIEALRACLAHRVTHGLDDVRARLLEQNTPWPWTLAEFAAVADAFGPRGVTHLHTHDSAGNVLTHCLISAHIDGLRAVLQAGLDGEYVRLNMMVDEWWLLRLHTLSVAAGHPVGEHMIIDVAGVGMLSLGPSTLGLIRRIGEGWKHYPERFVAIDDVNNTRVALLIWPLIRRFVPKQTAAKLRVSGTAYQEALLLTCAPTELPPLMGGTCEDERWAYLSSESPSRVSDPKPN